MGSADSELIFILVAGACGGAGGRAGRRFHGPALFDIRFDVDVGAVAGVQQATCPAAALTAIS